MPLTYSAPQRSNLGSFGSGSFTADLGSAEAGRIVLVSVAGVPGGGSPAFTSATVAGVSASLITEGQNGADDYHCWFYAVVPDGADTQTIALNIGDTVYGVVRSVWVLRGADSTPVDSDMTFDGSWEFTASATVTVTDGGAVFGASTTFAGNSPDFSVSTDEPNVSSVIDAEARGQRALDLDDLSAGSFTLAQDTPFQPAMSAVSFEAAGGGDIVNLTADDLQSFSDVSSPGILQTHILGASSLQSASNVSQPAIGQVHALTAIGLNSASNVTRPAVSQAHILAARSLDAASSVTQPAIEQVHDLGAVSVESASIVSLPVLAIVGGDVDALLADDLESVSEVVQPTLGQTHSLSARSLDAAAHVSAVTISQHHALTPDSLSSASDVSEPGIGQTHILTAANINSDSTVSSPAIRQAGELVALDLAALSEVTQPSIAQVHILSAANLDSAAQVSIPTLTPGASGLIADDLEAASEVGLPVLGQVHHLAAVGLSAASEVSRPAIDGQQHNTVMIRWAGLWHHRRDMGVWHRRRDVGIWHQRKITGRWRRA